MKEALNLKITIKAICLFEKMTNIPFAKIQDDTESTLPLLYCILISHPENNMRLTFEEMKATVFISDKLMVQLANDLKHELSFVGQFGRVNGMLSEMADVPEQPDKENNKEEKDVFVSDLIPILVSDCGLDINYIMNEMSYGDIESYLEYRKQKEQARMEDKRFWTYISMLPNINSKKCRGPEHLLPFPWEKAAKQKKFLSEIDDIKKQLLEYGIMKNDKDEKKDAE